MSDTFTNCDLFLLPIDIAPPSPPPPPPAHDGGAGAGGCQYVYITSIRINHSTDSLILPCPVFVPLRSFFAEPRRIIRGILSQLTREAEPPSALVDGFVELTAEVERSVAETPAYSNAPVVPIALHIEDEPVADQSQAVAADESAIEALDEAVESGEYRDRQCSICLEELGGPTTTLDYHDHGKKIVRTPCSHVYHKKCIVEWLKRNHLCPLCRYAMP